MDERDSLCPSCGAVVPAYAPDCPDCGLTILNRKAWYHRYAWRIVGAIAGAGLVPLVVLVLVPGLGIYVYSLETWDFLYDIRWLLAGLGAFVGWCSGHPPDARY